MNIPARDVPQGRFFVNSDPPPNNVFAMHVPPRPSPVVSPQLDPGTMRFLGEHFADVEHLLQYDNIGLCQNINDATYWYIHGELLVRLLREDEHDQTHFVI